MTIKLQENSSYPCPVCRTGTLQPFSLMEALGCSACRHLFTPDFNQQTLKLADSEIPLTWRWRSGRWQGLFGEGLELNWLYGLVALVFVLLPTSLMGFAAYLFPPMPGTFAAKFPWLWTGLTFFAHLACLGWLVFEYYQFPFKLYLRARLRRLQYRWGER